MCGLKLSGHRLGNVNGTAFDLTSADGSTLGTWEDVLELWRTSNELREHFTKVLAAVPYEAFYWETPAVSHATLWQPFSMVVLDASGHLQSKGDPSNFAEHILGPRRNCMRTNEVTDFCNLGKDATLLVPCPPTNRSGKLVTAYYGHLASFLRDGRKQQQHNLWRTLSEKMEKRLQANPSPVWISTAGNGVPWLHVRIDDRPKYIKYEKYRQKPHKTPRPAALGQASCEVEGQQTGETMETMETQTGEMTPQVALLGATTSEGLPAETLHAALHCATPAVYHAHDVQQATPGPCAAQLAKGNDMGQPTLALSTSQLTKSHDTGQPTVRLPTAALDNAHDVQQATEGPSTAQLANAHDTGQPTPRLPTAALDNAHDVQQATEGPFTAQLANAHDTGQPTPRLPTAALDNAHDVQQATEGPFTAQLANAHDTGQPTPGLSGTQLSKEGDSLCGNVDYSWVGSIAEHCQARPTTVLRDGLKHPDAEKT
eukprot:365707-Chlamydomonas_euryale.AAC.17